MLIWPKKKKILVKGHISWFHQMFGEPDREQWSFGIDMTTLIIVFLGKSEYLAVIGSTPNSVSMAMSVYS